MVSCWVMLFEDGCLVGMQWLPYFVKARALSRGSVWSVGCKSESCKDVSAVCHLLKHGRQAACMHMPYLVEPCKLRLIVACAYLNNDDNVPKHKYR